MYRSFSMSFIIYPIIAALAFSGCGDTQSRDLRAFGSQSNDNWLVSGQITNNGYQGGEVLALGLDGMRYRSRIGEDEAFAIQLPGNASYALYFLSKENPEQDGRGAIPSSHPKTEDSALLSFEESPDVGMRETLRLPKVLFRNSLNLGQIDIKEHAAYPSINPALNLDFDYDGINDFSDQDDQNDGLADLEQMKSTEQIEICHFNAKDQGKTLEIPLSSLFDHVQDGDSLGPCVARRPLSVNASSASAEVAPNPTLPPPQGPLTTTPQALPPAEPLPLPTAPHGGENVPAPPEHDASEDDAPNNKDHDDEATDNDNDDQDDSSDEPASDIEHDDQDSTKKVTKRGTRYKNRKGHVRRLRLMVRALK